MVHFQVVTHSSVLHLRTEAMRSTSMWRLTIIKSMDPYISRNNSDTNARELQREKNAADKERAGLNVTKDYSLKDGEKIKIKINSKKKNEHTDAETTDFNNGNWMEASSPNKNTASIESCGAQANTFAYRYKL